MACMACTSSRVHRVRSTDRSRAIIGKDSLTTPDCRLPLQAARRSPVASQLQPGDPRHIPPAVGGDLCALPRPARPRRPAHHSARPLRGPAQVPCLCRRGPVSRLRRRRPGGRYRPWHPAQEVAGFLSRFGIELAAESEAVQPEQQSAGEVAPEAVREAPNNLPSELGSFIGRQAEIAALREQLSRTRLLTICGGAGVGKTRTALQLAREIAPQFKDGVGLVELGSVSDADLVVQAVASVFGVRESGTSLKESLIVYLQKRTVLLILDNCEHLLDPCADFVDALLRRSSDLKVIATSRERLDIDGEIAYGLQMLPLPAAPEEVTVGDLPSYPALELFVEESVNADPAFKVTDHNIVQIAEICKRLDGNALAIKLAASLTPTLSVGEMLERLRERFDVLGQGRRQSVARHKTLKAGMG